MADVPGELKYTKEHEWVGIEGETAVVGITDFAQSTLGEIVFTELPAVGSTVKKDEPFGVVESIKSVSDLYAPLSGEVVGVNTALEDSPGSVNESPYESWMIKVKIGDASEAAGLLDAQAYRDFCGQQ